MRPRGVAKLFLRPIPRLWAIDPSKRKEPVGASSGSGRAAAGKEESDPEDLHKLVVEHGDAIYRLALSVVRDSALAEDIAQETLVKAWLALPSFRADSSLRSWVLRIAHNTAISTLRTRRAVVIDPHDLPERHTTPDRSVEARVQSDVVMDEFVDDCHRCAAVLDEMSEAQEKDLGAALAAFYSPPPDLSDRLERRVAERLDSRVVLDVVSDLFGAGIETSKLLLMEEPENE